MVVVYLDHRAWSNCCRAERTDRHYKWASTHQVFTALLYAKHGCLVIDSFSRSTKLICVLKLLSFNWFNWFSKEEDKSISYFTRCYASIRAVLGSSYIDSIDITCSKTQ